MLVRILAPLVLAFSLAPSMAQCAPPPQNSGQEMGTVQGTVFRRQNSELSPLANAVVVLSSAYEHFTVSADSNGRYVVPGLRVGMWRIRAAHVGYHPMAAVVRVPANGEVILDLSLDWEPIHLPPLLVRADPVRPLSTRGGPPPSDLGEMAIRAMEGSPGMVEGGLAQVVRSLPGNDPSDPQDVLLMRGSAADLKLVLLDGAPIYTPFHMAGLVESFDPHALGGASLFLGGAPARFDGGLSYILDLQGRGPDMEEIRGNAAVDLLSARMSIEGPLNESTGFLVGARSLHNLGTALLSRGSSPYGFGDVLARLQWNGARGSEGFLTGFWNHESVLLDLSDDQNKALFDEAAVGNEGLLGTPLPGDGAQWGNKALAGGLSGSIGDTRVEIRGALSRYDAQLPLGDTLPLFAQSRSDRSRLTLDISRPWEDGAVRFGASLDRVHSAYSAMALDPSRVGDFDQVDLDGSTGGAYLEVTRPISQSLSIRGGGRADRFEGDGRFRFAPRLSLTWMLTEDAALTLAAGRYHQYSNVNPGEIERQLGPDSTWNSYQESTALELSVGTADHLVVSLDQLLSPGLRLGLEGFVKEFTGIPGSQGKALHASGVDLRVAREGKRASGWLGYTLTWFWASEGILASGDSPFSGRHLLNAGFSAPVTDRAGLKVRASYGAGLPYTTVPVFAADALSTPTLDGVRGTRNLAVGGDQVLNAAPELTVGPDEGFLRLEVEIYGHWSPRISGRTMEIRPYLRVLNALNRRDALFYHFDPWRTDGPQPLADLPVLPLVGLEWRF